MDIDYYNNNQNLFEQKKEKITMALKYDPYATRKNPNEGRKLYTQFGGLQFIEGHSNYKYRGLQFKDFTVSTDLEDLNRGRFLCCEYLGVSRFWFYQGQEKAVPYVTLSAEIEDTEDLRKTYPDFLDATYDEVMRTGQYNFPGKGVRPAKVCEIMLSVQKCVVEANGVRDRVYLSYCIKDVEGHYENIHKNPEAEEKIPYYNILDRNYQDRRERLLIEDENRVRRWYELTDKISKHDINCYWFVINDYGEKRNLYNHMVGDSRLRSEMTDFYEYHYFNLIGLARYLTSRADTKLLGEALSGEFISSNKERAAEQGLSVSFVPIFRIEPQENRYTNKMEYINFKPEIAFNAILYREDSGKWEDVARNRIDITLKPEVYNIIRSVFYTKTKCKDAIEKLKSIRCLFADDIVKEAERQLQENIDLDTLTKKLDIEDQEPTSMR